MKKRLFYELKIGLIFLGSQGHFTEQFGSDLKITNVDYGTCIIYPHHCNLDIQMEVVPSMSP